MSEIFEGLGTEARDGIARVRGSRGFCWIDLTLGSESRDELKEVLDLPEHAMRPLLDFDPNTRPSRKFHADRDHVVFTMTCFLPDSSAPEGERPPRPVEVHVVVNGEYLLTVHQEDVSLPGVLPSYSQDDRDEQYVVYVVLDAIAATGFDALHDAELTLEGLQTMSADMGSSRVRLETLRKTNANLAVMRRRLSPQRGIFERISKEIENVQGLEEDSEGYFERVYLQLNRLIDAIDAASDSMAKLIDLRLNETMYWLTVVATIFLPLTFLVGFFGMNFAWMTDRIDTFAWFLILGIGLPLACGGLTWMLVQRRGTPVKPDPDAVDRLIAAIRKSARQRRGETGIDPPA